MEKLNLPNAIYTNRMYKSADDLHGKIITSDKKLSSSYCVHPLVIIYPYEGNDYKKEIGYSGHNNLYFKTHEELAQWVNDNVVFDFSDENSEYHSYSYFNEE